MFELKLRDIQRLTCIDCEAICPVNYPHPHCYSECTSVCVFGGGVTSFTHSVSGHLHDGEMASLLDAQEVAAAQNAHEAFFAPPCAPIVLNDPVGGARFVAPPHNRDGMIVRCRAVIF
eukprot:COSAG01_NODE_22604_length_848_cov_80.225634_1_plen_117_part_10